MRRILMSLALAALVVGASAPAQEKKAEKKAEAIAFKVEAVELALEFQKDPQAARRKYDPAPGGTIIQVHGIVGKVNNRDKSVTFDTTNTKVSVVLQAKKLTGPDKQSKKLASQATGTFKSFEKNTIVISCDEAMLLRIVEEKKK